MDMMNTAQDYFKGRNVPAECRTYWIIGLVCTAMCDRRSQAGDAVLIDNEISDWMVIK